MLHCSNKIPGVTCEKPVESMFVGAEKTRDNNYLTLVVII